MIKPHPQPQKSWFEQKACSYPSGGGGGGVLELRQKLVCSYAHVRLVYDPHAQAERNKWRSLKVWTRSESGTYLEKLSLMVEKASFKNANDFIYFIQHEYIMSQTWLA